MNESQFDLMFTVHEPLCMYVLFCVLLSCSATESAVLLLPMACPGPNDPGDPFTPPKTPRMVLKDDAQSQLSPDTEDNVGEQTDGVFRNFVYHMTTMHNSRGGGDDQGSSAMPELTAFADQPYS